jgi:hypothetical protein
MDPQLGDAYVFLYRFEAKDKAHNLRIMKQQTGQTEKMEQGSSMGDVNVDENDYTENHFSASERLDGIREEVTTTAHSQFARHEESTSDYEREEQKYVAEEKEFASSYQQEQTTMETRE